MRQWIGAVFLSAALACTKADILVLDPSPRPAKPADSVAVLLDEPTTPYRSVALIEVSDESWGLSLTQLGNKMKAEAAKLGGDAVIIGTTSSSSGAVIIPVGSTFIASPTSEKKLVGKVIVYTPTPP